MRISDWSSDVCSADLPYLQADRRRGPGWREERKRQRPRQGRNQPDVWRLPGADRQSVPFLRSVSANRLLAPATEEQQWARQLRCRQLRFEFRSAGVRQSRQPAAGRSEEHTSELQSLMRSSYAVLCLEIKK